VGGGARNPAIDEIKWITIVDKYGNDLEVMYANGPTATVQPKIEAFSDYKNIADEATISGHDDVKYLNDGLLSVYKYLNEDFGKYIQETVIEKTTTFTLDFEEARAVRAVMVYTSKDEFATFLKVARMEFVCIEDGKEVVRYIKDVELSAECYQANDYDGSIFYISPGAAAYALLYFLKTYYKCVWVKLMTHEAALLGVAAKVPATIFNAVVAIIFAPILAVAIRKALEKNHLTLD
jgi:hypothetical protein